MMDKLLANFALSPGFALAGAKSGCSRLTRPATNTSDASFDLETDHHPARPGQQHQWVARHHSNTLLKCRVNDGAEWSA